ncbi:hypothetical protein [Undibacterium sp. Ji22W]|uniref:hypothetical protein n=1 Tax=Undibacterium sp. Ji22W TaxID=3413038 RepID=UPI003BF30465
MKNPTAPRSSIMSTGKLSSWLRGGLWALFFSGILAISWGIAFHDLVKPGSDLGYNLGLTGGIMMLSLLLYPMRKRVRFLSKLGRMEKWFKVHMILGIGGPLLILFHSTFRIGSMNGRVALYSMLLVALSGVIGRFVYRRIHKGLYGKALSLAETQKILEASEEDIESVFLMRPELKDAMNAFHQRAFSTEGNQIQRAWRFLMLEHEARSLARRLRKIVKSSLVLKAKQQHWTLTQLRQQLVITYELIDHYLHAIIQTAQFTQWEKLFSLWHVVHIPFIYLLLFSGIVHVIAVHLY